MPHFLGQVQCTCRVVWWVWGIIFTLRVDELFWWLFMIILFYCGCVFTRLFLFLLGSIWDFCLIFYPSALSSSASHLRWRWILLFALSKKFWLLVPGTERWVIWRTVGLCSTKFDMCFWNVLGLLLNFFWNSVSIDQQRALYCLLDCFVLFPETIILFADGRFFRIFFILSPNAQVFWRRSIVLLLFYYWALFFPWL